MSTAIIAGAGIIGLSSALALAERGLPVTVLERGEPMREASWAAAGMLAARDPDNPPALRPLAAWSEALYPAFLARVEALSGMRVPLRTETTLQHQHGSRYELREWSLDPRDLCAALPVACRALGVEIRSHAEVTGLEEWPSGVRVCSGDGDKVHQADYFVDCRGAWCAAPPLLAEDTSVHPVKGQMLSVALPTGVTLTRTLRTPELYLVPRGDGRVIVGATVENAGFDRAIDPAATRALFAKAAALWTPLAKARVTDVWTGLRPGTPDGLPILDRLSARTVLATGHYRNGILLAPATAELVCALLLDKPAEVDLAPYRAARFRVEQERGGDDKHFVATL